MAKQYNLSNNANIVSDLSLSNRSILLKKQKGVALLFVLMIIAILIALSATMATQVSSQFYRTIKSQGHLQAYWYGAGAESLAIVAIEQSYVDNNKSTNMGQPWAIKDAEYPLGNGMVKGSVIDKQACFNVNVFTSLPQLENNQRHYLQEALIYMLQELEIDDYQSEQIADSIVEFVDENDEINTQTGVESASYQSFTPPYNAPNAMMIDDSELRAVNQISAEIMSKIDGLLCAIPTKELRLNVNTIETDQAIILASMFQPALSLEDAREIIDNRNNDGWSSVQDFLSISELSGVSDEIKAKAQPYLDVRSQYFELRASLTADESSTQLTSLIYSDDYKTASVIRRSLGGVQ